MQNQPLVDAQNDPISGLNDSPNPVSTPPETVIENPTPVPNPTIESVDVSTKIQGTGISVSSTGVQTPRLETLQASPTPNPITIAQVIVPVDSIQKIQDSAISVWLSVVIPQIPALIISFAQIANILKLPEWVIPLLILIGSFVTTGYKFALDIEKLFTPSL